MLKYLWSPWDLMTLISREVPAAYSEADLLIGICDPIEIGSGVQ